MVIVVVLIKVAVVVINNDDRIKITIINDPHIKFGAKSARFGLKRSIGKKLIVFAILLAKVVGFDPDVKQEPPQNYNVKQLSLSSALDIWRCYHLLLNIYV